MYELVENNSSMTQSLESKDQQKGGSQSRRTSKSELTVLGMCSVDLLPIILGKVTT